MAGRPRTRAIAAALERRTRAAFDEPDATHLDYVCAWVQSGGLLKTLAADVFKEAGLPPDTLSSMLGGYLRITFPDATARLDAARIEGSKAAVEDVDGIADESVVDAAQASRARNRMAARQYRAEVWDRSLRDKTAAVTVNLSVGEMRLEALRMRDSVVTPSRQLGDALAPQLVAGQPADLTDLL